MPAKRFFILSFLVAATFLTVIVGCEGPEGPQGPPGPYQVYIVGWVKNTGTGDSISTSFVDVYYMPEIPHVTINDIQLLYDTGPIAIGNPLRFFNYDLPIWEGDSVELLISYTNLDGYPAVAQANIMLPGPFEITIPDTSYDTVALGDSLMFCWALSDGADIYSTSFRLYYYYIDTADSSRYFHYDFETLLTDTFLIVSAAELFPDLGIIDSIEYGYGYFGLYAVNGPIQEGEHGNVTGDGFGFFNGWTRGGYIHLRVTNSPSLANEIVKPPNPMQKFYR